MNWKNVDLGSSYESSQPILDPYTFDQLLLELHCNLTEIDKDKVKEHFSEVLRIRVASAKQVFADNLDNIIAQAIKNRQE